MRLVVLTLLITALSPQTGAHYVFNRLIVNNTISREFQHVRDVSGNAGTYDDLWLKTFPIYGPENANVTCGRGSFPIRNADTIETATVVAGSDVGLMVSGPYYEGDVQGYIFHEGPGQVFLSRLPDAMASLKEYDGKGDFFKIAYAGPANKTTWSTMDTLSINFTIPAATPSGQYLLRIEHFMPSMSLGQSQWFVNCAHIEVVGGGNGIPTPMVSFPNAYAEDDPSVWFQTPNDLNLYIEPKPAVWKG